MKALGHYLYLLMIMFVLSCQTSTDIVFLKKGEVVRLDPKLGFEGYVGSSNVKVLRGDAFTPFLLIPDQDPDEYLLVFEPHLASSAIEVPDLASSNLYMVPGSFYRYFNLLMRAHRDILRRELDKAERVLKVLDETYDVTYGSLVLAANIAVLRGDQEKALNLYKQARQVYTTVSLKKFGDKGDKK